MSNEPLASCGVVEISTFLASVDEEAIASTIVGTHNDAAVGDLCTVMLVEPKSMGSSVDRWSASGGSSRDGLRRCVDRALRRLISEASAAGIKDPSTVCAEIIGNVSDVRLTLEFRATAEMEASAPKHTQLVATLCWRRQVIVVPKAVKSMCAALWNGRWLSNNNSHKKKIHVEGDSLRTTLLPPPHGDIRGQMAFEAYRVIDPIGGMLVEKLIVAGVDERYAYLAIKVRRDGLDTEEAAAHVVGSTLGIVGKVPVPAQFHTSLAGKKGKQGGSAAAPVAVGFGEDDEGASTDATLPVHALYAEYSRINSKGSGFKFRGRYDSDDSVPQHVRYINESVRPKKHSDARTIRWLNASRYAVAMRDSRPLPNVDILCFAPLVKVFADRDELVCELEDVHIVGVDAKGCTNTTFATNADIELALQGTMERILRRVKKFQDSVAANSASLALSHVDVAVDADSLEGEGVDVSKASPSSPTVAAVSSVTRCAAKVLEDFLGGGDGDTPESISADTARRGEMDASRLNQMGDRIKDFKTASFTTFNVPEFRSRLSVFNQLEKVFKEALVVEKGSALSLSAASLLRVNKSSAKSTGAEMAQQVLRSHVINYLEAGLVANQELLFEEGPFVEFKHHLSAATATTGLTPPPRGGRQGQHQADAERIRHTIAAMASSAFGGVLVVGVNDDGEVIGHPSGEVKNSLRTTGFTPALPKDAVIIREIALINNKPTMAPSTTTTTTPAAASPLQFDGFGSSPLANLFSGLSKVNATPSKATTSSTPTTTKPAQASPPLVVSIVLVRPGPAPYYLPTGGGYHHSGPGQHPLPTGKVPPPVLPVVRGIAGNRAMPTVAAVATIAVFAANQQHAKM